ncbi:MAG: sialate O-acetylesterase [Saprospiraceae bacterium]
MTRFIITLLLCLLGQLNLVATVQLPDILTDNMVLQREQPVPIWGTAAVGEKVVVTFGKQQKETTADEQGNWKVFLAPLKVSFQPTTLKINEHELKNILVGEVWLCSGQSNMQWTVAQSGNGQDAISKANYPNIRLFNVSREVAFKRKEGKLATWQACSPQSVADFSGVGYFLGQDLFQKLQVPIGLINASYGGSQVEAWTPRPYLQTSADFLPCIEREKIWAAERAQVKIDFKKAIQDWEKADKVAKEKEEKSPKKPRVPDALRDYRIAGSIYENLIAPLIPFGIKGVTWYQGESNEERAEQYRLLLPTMIQSWRDKWQQEALPFCLVQLPNFRPINNAPEDIAWSHLRESQRRVAEQTEKVDMVVTIDLGEVDNGHPSNKKDVGLRLAKWAISTVYRGNEIWSGPMYKKAKIKKGKVVLFFDQIGKGLQISQGSELKEFTIAGKDKQWHWAKAKIKGKKKIVVWSDKVKAPLAVRYAFNQNPSLQNLTNHSGLPASPFRTDDWPGPTAGKR